MENLNLFAYGFNIVGCLWSCIILVTLQQLRDTTNPRYRLACRILALASLIVAIGHIASRMVNYDTYVLPDVCSFPIILIASLQALLFTSLLLLLIKGRYGTWRYILLLGWPALLFSLLYGGACLLWDDKMVYSLADWSASLSNPPLLIRSLFTLAYVGQLVAFTCLFFRERRSYRLILHEIENKDKHVELRWMTVAFCSALFIGVCALVMGVCPDIRVETALITIFAIFYPAFAILYTNAHYAYEQVRRQIADSDIALPPPPDESDMEELITYLQPLQHDSLFIHLETYLKKENPHLDPNFKRSDLLQALGTNERYLAVAVGRATGLTVQEYLLRRRILYAMDELILPDDNRTIDQIAFDSGFTTTRTFQRNFIRLAKVKPSEYREIYRQKKGD